MKEIGNFLLAMVEGAAPLIGYGVMVIAFALGPWHVGQERKRKKQHADWGARIYDCLCLLGAAFMAAFGWGTVTGLADHPKGLEHALGIFAALVTLGFCCWVNGLDSDVPLKQAAPEEPEKPAGVTTRTTRFRR